MPSNELEFYGLVFFSGSEFLPRDIPLDLDKYREWALRQGLIFDPESQLLHTERVQELAKCFSSDDRLLIAIVIYEDRGELVYTEYPYLHVRSLIRRAEEVKIVYWRMVPNSGEVSFGFRYPGCDEELCSFSTAKRVNNKFDLLLAQLSSVYDVKSFKDGSKEITVDGTVCAQFFKDGRFFDVNLSLAN